MGTGSSEGTYPRVSFVQTVIDILITVLHKLANNNEIKYETVI